MELGLSIGNTPSKLFHGVTKNSKTATTTAATSPSAADSSCSFGSFCMAIADDRTNNDEEDHNTTDDQQTEKEKPRVKAINPPPVHLDLLPAAHHLPNSDNGSLDGGSSRNALAGKGLEEAAPSLQLDFDSSYRRTRNIEAVEMERASSRASDEDENGSYRKKLRFSKQQSAYLEESYKYRSTPDPKQKLELAKQLDLSPRQVEVWFQNRRARTKVKQTEVDCEYLKKCCETLTVENRRLHKELQELIIVSKTTSNPFYALTMCPSCECVATTDKPPLLPTTSN